MKTYFLFLCLLCSIGFGFSQNQASDFTGRKSDQPRNPRNDLMNFVPNEVIVKFKDEVPMQTGARMKAAGVSSVDKVLQAHGITLLEKLFPTEQKPLRARMMKSPQGKDMKIPALDKIYRISVPPAQPTDSMPTNIFQLIEELKALPEVEYAEPNYIFTIGDFSPAGPVITVDELSKQKSNIQKVGSDGGLIPNDPLYSQQWGIPATNIDKVWNTTTGDSTSIIAILDTGVDWQHPDLAANIWTNTQEIPDNGIDDDGDGLIDDIRGWDYINNDNNPMDDNSHGTHVAGIAAAVGNNGIGIAGVNWHAKIMPIKVFQSSGKGDAATIAKGVNYAASKGATVINMSFGSYSESLTLKDALANAYATTVLVAAAGNDQIPIGPCNGCFPMYPAAYSFVLGVEALPRPPIGFTNFDQDGPVFSKYNDLLNYELIAPGTDIISCVPGGNYRKYNGTSMAAPLVAGAVSLYRQQKPGESQEMLFGNLINSLGQYIDLEKALNIIPEPKLDIVSYSITDTIDGDRDGRPDAGETIELKVKVRNTWGQANNVKVGLEFGEFEDQATATILNPEASIGSVSAYATKENSISLKLKLSANINDGRDIVFKLKTWYGDHLGEKDQTITINVENGVELKGFIDSTLILDNTKNYIVSENVVINADDTLYIRPGTKISFFDGKKLTVWGTIIAEGKKDSIIEFRSRENGFGGLDIKNSTFSFVKISGINNNNIAIWVKEGQATFVDCLIEENQVGWGLFPVTSLNPKIELIRTNFYNNKSAVSQSAFENLYVRDVNIINNSAYSDEAPVVLTNTFDNQITSNIFSNKPYDLKTMWYGEGMISLDCNSYFGSQKKETIQKKFNDYFVSGQGKIISLKNFSFRPSNRAHSIIWKVLVNGKDAQDEYDLLDPLGVGRQKMEVYFNRAMDTKYPPTVSMGVRYPYSQTAIADDGTWSADSTIYTVYKNVGLTTGDGINTIRVTGAKDMDHFEIPIEDRRFRVVVSAATSASLDFMATAGLGKVNLEWNNNDLADGLGYNMYRMENINDSTLTKPILVNKSLIADTLYTDFSVTPNKKYYYYYKILRTNLAETDSSKVVSAIPFTASKGDANGDLSVNVLDITTIVAYLLNNNPQPFIFEAADVNSDGVINVLDIVGVVNLVLNGPHNVKGLTLDQQANLYLQNDTLFADVNVPIGGIQLDIRGVSSIEDIQTLAALQGFESGYSMKNDTLRLLYYSMSGKSIPAGTHIPLLVLKKGSKITDAIFGGTNGSPIRVNFLLTRIPDISNNMNQSVAELGQNFPNPLNGLTTIPIHIYEPIDEAVVRIVNMMGQEVEIIRMANPYIGEHLLSWNPGMNKGLFVYTLEVITSGQRSVCPNKKMIVQ